MLFYLDIEDCTRNPCHGNGTCNNTIGSFTCTCHDGFTGDGMNCEGRDPCFQDLRSRGNLIGCFKLGQRPTNTIASKYCDK